MPLYTFKDTETGEVFDKHLKIAERELYLKENPHIQTVITAPRIVSGVGSKVQGVPNSHREVISEIKKKHPKHTINDH